MKLFLFTIIILVVYTGCQEIYQPEVDSEMSALAVDGLLTDKPDPLNIRLQLARQFDSAGIGTPVLGAGVSVSDDLGHIYPFYEKKYGNYVADNSAFIIQSDRKYVLHINSPDGSQYESSVQELIPNKEIDNIYGRIITKNYVKKNYYGEVETRQYEGIETFVDFLPDHGQTYQFRFNIKLFILYTYSATKKRNYGWRMWNFNENINITETRYQTASKEIIAHQLSFFPTEKSYYSFEDDLWKNNFHVEHWILIVDKFRLNDDSYSFYKKTRDQLAAEDKLFDPIAIQINGNIKCANNPLKIVLGNFEVSSKETITYVVSADPALNTVTYLKIPNLSNVSDEGSSTSPPDFWIN
jgi:hypothetical protein